MREYKMIEAKILRKHGMKCQEIAWRLNLSCRTIYNYLNDLVFNDKRCGRPAGESILKPFYGYIDDKLQDDLYLNGENLFLDLLGMGYTGKITILRDYLHERRLGYQNQAVFRFETMPGKQAQVDWSVAGWGYKDGRLGRRYVFIMKLGYSRRPYMEFTYSKEQSVLFACLKRAFVYFGGIPEEILFDNEKTMFYYDVIERKWKVHTKLLCFAGHYGFIPRRCMVRRPQTKGKVERELRYLKHSFYPMLPNREDLSNEELNELVLVWLKGVDNKILREFNQTRLQRFQEDLRNLKPLPLNEFDHRAEEPLYVSREGQFTFNTNRYSVPAEYIGKRVVGYRDPDTKTMDVYDGKKLIKTVYLLPDGANGKVTDHEDRKSLYEAWKKARDFQQKQVHKAAEVKRRRAQGNNVVQDPAVYDVIYHVSLSASKEVHV